MANCCQKSNTIEFSFYEVIKSMAKAMDLISETVVGHHKKVAYISLQLGRQLKLSAREKQKLVLTGLIHDLGVFYLNQKFSDLSFDKKDNKHARVGYELSKELWPEKEIPKIIKYHHHDYSNKNQQVPLLSHVIYLADRIAVIINDKLSVLEQADKIKNVIKKYSKKRFWPEAVNKFIALSNREAFWLDTISGERMEKELDNFFCSSNWTLSLNELLNISILMSHIIDFRSNFTATHSKGVAIISAKLAQKFDFNKNDCDIMKIAGYFHDIGKLIVPREILNKPDKLNSKEWNLMKTHTYFTYHSLSDIWEFDKIKKWASYHHEKLNGEGYPFQLNEKDLSLGSRIMAVADVFTALTEDRPYRTGMSYDKVKKILCEMSGDNALDQRVTSVIIDNFNEFDSVRCTCQKEAEKYYRNFRKNVNNL